MEFVDAMAHDMWGVGCLEVYLALGDDLFSADDVDPNERAKNTSAQHQQWVSSTGFTSIASGVRACFSLSLIALQVLPCAYGFVLLSPVLSLTRHRSLELYSCTSVIL